MARRHSRVSFTRPPPRTKIWVGAGVGQTTLGGSAKTLVVLLGSGGLALRPFTILRTRMLLTFESDQEAATERATLSYGEIVVTEAAAGVGITALPDPSGISGDADADWYVWQAAQVTFQHKSSVGTLLPMVEYVIDSKAMRKVGPDDQVVGVASMETAAGGLMFLNGRQLIQLH